MLDKLEYRIAKDLANHHFYPFAEHNYLNIFKAFSYFPVNFKDIGLKEEGKSVTYLALVAYHCFDRKKNNFEDTYQYLLNEMKKDVQHLLPQDITVETFLGCVLYFYHPTQIREVLSSAKTLQRFDEKQKYEFNLKKKTLSIYAI